MGPIRTKLLVIALSLCMAPAALASTWFVDGRNGDDGNDCKSPATACGSIGHAIQLSASGDSIQIAAATYQENFTIPFDLTLIGAKAKTTIIDGGYNLSVIAIGSTSAHVSVSNLTIERGAAPIRGGGIYNYGILVISDTVFTLNTGNSGGAIFNAGTATISNTSIINNGTGGVHTAVCGAIDNQGTMTITNSTLSGNSDAPTNFTYGGAICNRATLTINDSTLTKNTSDGVNTGAGGAIYNLAQLAINNSTLSGNSASGVYGGGAIYNEGGTVTISNSTLSGNTSGGPGGGINNNSNGTVTLQNSIVANSHSGGNCAGAMTSNGYNLSSDLTCNFNNTGDLNKKNPSLGPLKKNGGPTQTMALKTGSPAIDAGNPGGCTDNSGQLLTTDQRGQPRPDTGETGCDMGAYESQGP
jgi:hypothetical protein